VLSVGSVFQQIIGFLALKKAFPVKYKIKSESSDQSRTTTAKINHFIRSVECVSVRVNIWFEKFEEAFMLPLHRKL